MSSLLEREGAIALSRVCPQAQQETRCFGAASVSRWWSPSAHWGSLARPGGNITGVTFVSSDLAAKRLQFLREIAPNLARVAVIWNPDHVDPEYRETQTAAKTLGIQLQSLEVRSAEDFDTAFQIATDARIEALIPITSRLMLTNRRALSSFQGNINCCLHPALGRG